MRAPRDAADYLQDMAEYADKACRLIDGLDYATFAADEKTHLAVIRCLEVIGEAAKKVPAAFRKRHPAVPWAEAAGIRDILVHDYFGVNLEVVWNTVLRDLPSLKRALVPLLASNTGPGFPND